MKKHMKRLAAPKSWPVERKTSKFITRPLPAKSKELAMPANLIIRDMLRHASTAREVSKIVRNNNIIVDGKKISEPRHPVGIMDTFTISETGENYRMLLDKKGKLTLKPISHDEAKLKVCRINSKATLKKGRLQLGLHDGRTIIAAEKAGTEKQETYRTGDSLLLKLPEQKIESHIKLEKKATVYLLGGKHTGSLGTVEDIKGSKLTVKINGNGVETLKRFALAVGKDKPLISL
ncbi:30S ribosomal protein S4e [Candidatus Woesearchaeota archaeon]|nr:30S ribosomal protein S4e [Candidatus Woesearchaeota archaeon]